MIKAEFPLTTLSDYPWPALKPIVRHALHAFHVLHVEGVTTKSLAQPPNKSVKPTLTRCARSHGLPPALGCAMTEATLADFKEECQSLFARFIFSVSGM